jgi:exopolyphosphatase / guanosine-5'-triphosphate,3'-diphosphate pyrophosphatase
MLTDPAEGNQGHMKIAAIDLGSNSIHMVVVEASASGGFRVIGREKEMVRLGASTLARHHLSSAAMKRGLETLAKYKRLCETQGVDKLIAVATSAVREAGNGEDFLDRVGRAIGFWPKAVSGEEEARLIYLAALHSIHLEGRRALVIDVGGGSVELALGAGKRLDLVASEKLGVLRMAQAFGQADPLPPKDEARLVEHVERHLRHHAARVRELEYDVAVGTSGTILALATLALTAETGAPPETLHHVTVKAEALREVRRRLVGSTMRDRLRMPGMDLSRADIIVTGAVVVDTVLQRTGVKELVLCEWALREGILLDYMQGHRRSVARAEAYPDVRRRSVASLAERCAADDDHGKHVARLAHELFEGTRRLHGLGDEARSLLEYAALLHDIGHHISYPGHHKHTYYLIKNGGLRGFHPIEIEVLANVARYHRRGHPRRKHAGFGLLPREARRTVRTLAALLRVADALDRSHRQVVRGLTVSGRGRSLLIRGQAEGDSELELWGVQRRAELMEEVFGVPVRVDIVPEERARRAREA